MRNDFIREALQDERRFLSRLWQALLVSAAITFTWALFGPLDLTLRNGAFLTFSAMDIAVPCLLFFAGITVVLALLLALTRGKVYDLLLSLVAGLLLASYLQGTFLNIPMGKLNGDQVLWNRYAGHALFNTALWCTLVALPRLLYAINKKIWQRSILFLSMLLIAMQLTSLAVSFASPDQRVVRRAEYLSTAGMYEVSSKDNILVFLLDRLDTAYIDEVKESDPSFFDRFDGFTYYPNNTSMYCRTFPSVTYMLTNKLSLYDTPAGQYFGEAWSESRFLPTLRAAGYGAKVYTSAGYIFSDIIQLQGQVDNIAVGTPKPKTNEILQRIAQLTAYRYMPHALKPSFWLATSDFEGLSQEESGLEPYRVDDFAFYQGLVQNGLSISGEQSNFAFYHLNGCHNPIILTEDVRKVLVSTQLAQTKAAFNIVSAYIDRLKALGLYDNATIIITGDHGISDDFSRLYRAKTTGLFVKPKSSAGTPIRTSDVPQTSAYFEPSILEAAGIDPAPFGPTYTRTNPDLSAPRKFFYRVDLLDENTSVLEEFEIDGDARKFENYRKIDELPMPYPYT